jgi:hypothetical protein
MRAAVSKGAVKMRRRKTSALGKANRQQGAGEALAKQQGKGAVVVVAGGRGKQESGKAGPKGSRQAGHQLQPQTQGEALSRQLVVSWLEELLSVCLTMR